MAAGEDYRNEVLSGWFDMRWVLADRRRIISQPHLVLNYTERLRSTPFKFAVKTIVLPAALLAFLTSLPANFVDLPPAPREQRIAKLEARADSTEASAERQIASNTARDEGRLPLPRETGVDSMNVVLQASLDSVRAIYPDTAGLRESAETALTRMQNALTQFKEQTDPLVSRLKGLHGAVSDSAALRDSTNAIVDQIVAMDQELHRTFREERAKLDDINDEYRDIFTSQDKQIELIGDLSLLTGFEIGLTMQEVADAERERAAIRLAQLKVQRLVSEFRLPIAGAFVILNAFLFGLIAKDRFVITVRRGADFHMYFASAFLLFPTIAIGLTDLAADIALRFPDTPYEATLPAIVTVLILWVISALWRAAGGISSVMAAKDGVKGDKDRSWIMSYLVVSSLLTSSIGAVLLGLITSPIARLIVTLDS